MAPPSRPRVMVAVYAAILVIVVLDWLTPAGVVVGLVLSLPIILTSTEDDERHVWVATAVATIGFTVAAAYGRGPLSPPSVWIPNRVFAFLTIPAAGLLATLLQRRRLAAERALAQALAARDLNRLLMSLLAHDLRSPLTLANEGIVYVENAVAREQEIDLALLGDVRARLRRSLRALEAILTVVKAEAARLGDAPADGTADPEAETVPTRSTSYVRRELVAELDAFAHEAAERRKSLVQDMAALPDEEYLVDVLVARQALAVLLDNAIRYAAPGPIHVSAALEDGTLVMRVADPGPADPTPREAEGAQGMRGLGIGLDLCRALVRHAGGTLAATRDAAGRTLMEVRLPIARTARDAGPDRPAGS